MPTKSTFRAVATAAAAAGTFTAAHGSVTVESSNRRTLAAVDVSESGALVDSDSSGAVGDLLLQSSIVSPEWHNFAEVTLNSSSSAAGMTGVADLAQTGFDPFSTPFSRFTAVSRVDHVMTFFLDEATAYRMSVGTVASTWDVPSIYGLAIAQGAWTSLDDDGLTLLDSVAQPLSGTAAREGVLAPGRYTAFYRFTTEFFGPNTLDLSTASLTYSLSIPAPGGAASLLPVGLLAARRRRGRRVGPRPDQPV